MMDPRFLKWMGEVMVRTAENVEAMSRLAPGAKAPFSGMGAEAPFVAMTGWWKDLGMTPPFAPADAEKLSREWLAFFGAVPKKDLEELESKAAALAAENEVLRQAMENMAASMAGLKELPESMKPWVKLMSEAAGKQMEWFSELQKRLTKTAEDREE